MENYNIFELYADSKAEKAELQATNEILSYQAKALLRIPFIYSKLSQYSEDFGTEEEAIAMYKKGLAEVETLRDDLRVTHGRVDAASLDAKAKYELASKKCKEATKAFRDVRRELALRTACSDKKWTPKSVDEYMDKVEELDEKMEGLRLELVELKQKMEKIEKHSSDSHGGGVQLIDFEQLKVENKGLTEKIEDRHEELLRLRRKTTVSVQILSHMREKLTFVQQKDEELKRELAELDASLKVHRDTMSVLKRKRDKKRQETDRARREAGLHASQKLLEDYNIRAVEVERLKEREKHLMAECVSVVGPKKAAKMGITSERLSGEKTE
ncbi:hypothetical protein ADUPG1_007789 [Aduncisulcus paluster]|uniref:CCDC113/CCDC96 coiled-coil domain-containing protein n=1 Tax=Aduncisulcus paluster TaxID=2918883 RepID=A0ABQ5KSL2_9EUKA|nr:hypothetical protein ADUPG1_007789 [Aduncisulcus paluster]